MNLVAAGMTQNKKPQRPNGSLTHGRRQQLQHAQTQQFLPSDQPVIILLPLNDTFEPKCVILPYLPDVVKIGRQTNKSTIPDRDNGYFDSKVLSRQHAELWADRSTGRACIRDVRSSNGTFINGVRLSKENEESEVRELFSGDTLELGIDILNDENGQVVHRKVSARVDYAGLLNLETSSNPYIQQVLAQHAQPNGGSSHLSSRDGSNGSLSAMQNGQTQRIPLHLQSSNALNNAALPLSVLNSHNSASTLYGTSQRNITIDMVVKKLSHDLQVSRSVESDLKLACDIFDKLQNGSEGKSEFDDIDESKLDFENMELLDVPKSPMPVKKISNGTASSMSSEQKSSPSLSPNRSLRRGSSAGPRDSPSLMVILESTRRDLEQKSQIIEELELAIQGEREARLVLEERLLFIQENEPPRSRRLSSSTITPDSDETWTPSQQFNVIGNGKNASESSEIANKELDPSELGQVDELDPPPFSHTIYSPSLGPLSESPFSPSSLSPSAGPSGHPLDESAKALLQSQHVKDLAMSLKEAQSEIEIWKVRAQVVEAEHAKYTARLSAMQDELEALRCKTSPAPNLTSHESHGQETSKVGRQGVEAAVGGQVWGGPRGALFSAVGIVVLGMGLMGFLNHQTPTITSK